LAPIKTRLYYPRNIMPYCKNCHREITKFDIDVCPFCGEKNPIDDNYKTMDMTQHIDPQAKGYGLYKSKSQKKAAFYCAVFGFFGLHDFYLGFKKRAIYELLSSVFIIGGAGCVLFFTKLFPDAWAFLIPFFFVWAIYIIVAIYIFKKDSLKDANGEFLR